MENTQVMTVKDANRMAYQELAQIQIPAELTFSIGVHVGRALMMLKDCIESMEKDEAAAKAAEQQEKPTEEVQEELPDTSDVEFKEENDA